MTDQLEIKDDPNYRTVLDHGFVGLVDTMGDDSSIVQAARVSYGSGTKAVRQDRGLIRYLRRHHHTTPFEMVEFKFHCKMPIFVARQWIRHRTASVNEYSARYSVLDKEFYIPEIENIQPQSQSNNQGRDGELTAEYARSVRKLLQIDAERSYEHYKILLADENADTSQLNYSCDGHDVALHESNFPGIARELARMNLPVNFYTQWYWKIDLHNLMHFLRLRLDGHAQYEIRAYAQAMYDLVREKCPIAFEAFEDYVRQSTTISRMEKDLIKEMMSGKSFDNLVKEFGDEKTLAKHFDMSARELNEFKQTWDL